MTMLLKSLMKLGLLGSPVLMMSAAGTAQTPSPTPSGIEAELAPAVGIVDVFPFEDKSISLQCTAFHLGDGYMATAGHCFIGSYDCNNAQVRWANKNNVSTCTEVVYSFASESLNKLNANHRDLTIFKVNVAPNEKLKIGRDSLEAMRVQTLAVTGLSVKVRHVRVTSSSTGPCTLIAGQATSIFGQPKPKDTVQHNCSVGAFAPGTPIIDAQTGELLAIQQSSTLLPAIDSQSETYLKEINYAKTLTELELLKIIHTQKSQIKQLGIGGFSPEVFANGFRDRLNMKVATLGEEIGTQSVSFIPHNGVDTQVEITDGDGRTTIISGPRRAYLEQRIEFKAPVQIRLKSTHSGIAPALWLEDIERH